MNICFITYMYPGKHDTSSFAFVKQLVDAIADKGHHCFVLAPFNISHYHRFSQAKEEYDYGKGKVTVYRPGYFSFSNWHIGKFYISLWLHRQSIQRSFRKLKIKPDVIYGHFWNAGYEGYEYAKKYNIPLFVASGESIIGMNFIPKNKIDAFRDYISGVICVSSKNRDESIRLGLTTAEKCGVFPNAINADLFKKLNKSECRNKLGINKDAFVVAFVGWFNERKGPLRVSDAIKTIDGETVCSIFVGKGEQVPDCDNILYIGALPHDDVPVYLNAADVFVLPTLQEGCCNAVVEAMACGLPIVSSNKPFNWDVLDKSNSILIDPINIKEIAGAIKQLRDNKELRQSLSDGALQKAANLTIEKRSNSIVKFIQSNL